MATDSRKSAVRATAKVVLEALEMLVPLGPGPAGDALRRGGRGGQHQHDNQ